MQGDKNLYSPPNPPLLTRLPFLVFNNPYVQTLGLTGHRQHQFLIQSQQKRITTWVTPHFCVG